MSEHDDQMRAIFHSVADEVQLPPGSDTKLLRAARRKRKLTAGIATLSLVLALGGIAGATSLWNPPDQGPGTEIGGSGEGPAHYDETSDECVGDSDAALEECNAELGRVRSALKNAATAQESFATTTADGSYTDRFADLAEQGFEKPDEIVMEIFGPSVSEVSYCIEAYSGRLGGTVHYSSLVGSTEAGSCFPELEAALRNAAMAEESYTTSYDRYTEDIAELRAEGLALSEDVELTITASRRKYCIEGFSVELQATLHLSSDGRVVDAGPCKSADG